MFVDGWAVGSKVLFSRVLAESSWSLLSLELTFFGARVVQGKIVAVRTLVYGGLGRGANTAQVARVTEPGGRG